MPEAFLKLSSCLLAMKLCYHNAHHLASRVAFFGDHEALNDFYSELDSDYDSAVERMIGLYSPELANLPKILSGAVAISAAFPSTAAQDNQTMFVSMLQMEQQLIAHVELMCKSPDCKESTKQLVSEIGNKAEMRVYKLKQRVKK